MRSKTIIITITLILILSGQTLARQEINLLDPKYFWRSPNPETRIEFSDSGLTISSTNSSTGIYNLLPLNTSIRALDLIIIRMKTHKSGLGEVSWTDNKTPFSKERSHAFCLRKTNRYHTYYLYLKPRAKDKKIDHILFFPFRKEGKAEIVSFKFVKSSFWQKFIAGWQEFWSPEGRGLTIKTFLVMESPKLFGRSVFFYFNWMIAVFLLFSLLIKRPKWTIFLILALWVFLEISSAVNNWHFFKYNQVFWGKSLEEKRALQNPKDFYKFMKFAEEKIPLGSSFNLMAERRYPHIYGIAEYYLYPRKSTGKNEDYLLVFDRKPTQKIWARFKMWQKFRNGAYILKSKNAL